MDNFGFNVTCEGDETFKRTLQLALDMRMFKQSTHYMITKEHGLVFFWSEPKDVKKDAPVQPLPYPMDAKALIDFALNWLRNGADYGKQPDHDGDNGKGWRIYVEGWGLIAGSHYAIIGILPAWAMYGK